MKKLIALLAVCGFAIAFAACGKKAETAEQAADSAATAVETIADSAVEVIDSTADAAVDSIKAAH
ncbi:MAG TPA: hypothetical protein VGK59_09790 [Ohtaekwangia sp.]